jgi:hypothetical protein
MASQDYKEGVQRVLKKGLQQFISFGAIPYRYKMMGMSPRIILQGRPLIPLKRKY